MKTVESKFTLKDIVYIMHNNKIQEMRVESVTITNAPWVDTAQLKSPDSGDKITLPQKDMYATRDELLASL